MLAVGSSARTGFLGRVASCLASVKYVSQRSLFQDQPTNQNDDDPASWGMEEEGGRRRRGVNIWKVRRKRFTTHVINLVRKGKVEEAREVFSQMLQNSVRPDDGVFNALIAGYGRRGDIQTAFKLFNDMKKRAILPTNHAYTSLFNACSIAGPNSLDYLTRIREEIDRRNIILNTIASNALMSALIACGRPEEAFEVYSDMQKVHMEPQVQTFGSLLGAAAADGVTGLTSAQRVWQEMLAYRIVPDTHCYCLLLHCLRDSGIPAEMRTAVGREVNKLSERQRGGDTAERRGEEGTSERRGEEGTSERRREGDTSERRREGVVVELRSKGEGGGWESVYKNDIIVEPWAQVPVPVSGNRRLNLYLGAWRRKRGGRVEGREVRWIGEDDASWILSEVKDLQKWGVKVFHMLACLLLDPAFLLTEMGRRRVEPDAPLMVAAIRTQAHCGNVQGAKCLHSVAQGMGLSMDQTGYQAIASGCSRLSDGQQLLADIREAGQVANEYVYGTLVTNAARSRAYEYLIHILKEMRKDKVLPNEFITGALDTAAQHKPKTQGQLKRFNGFKGYYELWKRSLPTE